MKCRRGFKVGKGMRIKCTDEGQWVGGQGECVPDKCPPLTSLPDGQVEPLSCIEGMLI